MKPNQLTVSQIKKEIEFSTARSGGSGGQNVNKVNTKVILKFNINTSEILSPEQKLILLEKLKNKLTTEGVLIVSAENQRSQLRNKETAFKKIDRLFTSAFKVPKKRKPTRPTKASVKRRLDSKKINSEKKKMRKSLD